jgi:DNA-binding IscR family transcriptional regulator
MITADEKEARKILERILETHMLFNIDCESEEEEEEEEEEEMKISEKWEKYKKEYNNSLEKIDIDLVPKNEDNEKLLENLAQDQANDLKDYEEKNGLVQSKEVAYCEARND